MLNVQSVRRPAGAEVAIGPEQTVLYPGTAAVAVVLVVGKNLYDGEIASHALKVHV
jgi:hypothetical protein